MLTRKARGYLTITGPGGVEQEADTATCAHCCGVWIVKSKTGEGDLGGWCRMCGAMICPKCADKGSCTPFEKRLLKMEARSRMLRMMEA